MYSVYLGYCAPRLSLLFQSLSSFNLALFSPGMHNGKEKMLNNNFMQIKRFFKDVIYLFCFQVYLKHFLENYWFCRKSRNGAYSIRGWVMLFVHFNALRTKSDMWLTPKFLLSKSRMFEYSWVNIVLNFITVLEKFSFFIAIILFIWVG